MHKTFKSQKRYNLDKTPRSHTKVWRTKVCPNYIKESTQHKIDSKVHQVNKANANEHKGSLKHTCPNDFSHFKNIEQNQEKR
jgi:hypothetical protein